MNEVNFSPIEKAEEEEQDRFWMGANEKRLSRYEEEKLASLAKDQKEKEAQVNINPKAEKYWKNLEEAEQKHLDEIKAARERINRLK